MRPIILPFIVPSVFSMTFPIRLLVIIPAVQLLLIASPLYAGGGSKILGQIASGPLQRAAGLAVPFSTFSRQAPMPTPISRQAIAVICLRTVCAAYATPGLRAAQSTQTGYATRWNRRAWPLGLPPARSNASAAMGSSVQLADAAALKETIESVLERLHTASRMVLDATEASAFTVTFETGTASIKHGFYKQEQLLAALTRIKQGLAKLPRHAYRSINLDWKAKDIVVHGVRSPSIEVSMSTRLPNESLKEWMPSYFWSALYRVVGIDDSDVDAEDDLLDGPYAK